MEQKILTLSQYLGELREIVKEGLTEAIKIKEELSKPVINQVKSLKEVNPKTALTYQLNPEPKKIGA